MMWYDNRYRFLEKFVVVSILVDRQALYRNNQCDGHARQSLSIPRQRAKHKQLNMIPVNDREIECNTCFSSTRWHTPASDVYSCRPRVIFYGLQAQFPSSLLVLCFLGLECNLLLYREQVEEKARARQKLCAQLWSTQKDCNCLIQLIHMNNESFPCQAIGRFQVATQMLDGGPMVGQWLANGQEHIKVNC